MNPRTLCGLFTVLKGLVSKDSQTNKINKLKKRQKTHKPSIFPNSSQKWGPLHLAVDWVRGKSLNMKGQLFITWALHLAFLRGREKRGSRVSRREPDLSPNTKLFHPGFKQFYKKSNDEVTPLSFFFLIDRCAFCVASLMLQYHKSGAK